MPYVRRLLPLPNDRSVSTTWTWKERKIARGGAARAQSASVASRRSAGRHGTRWRRFRPLPLSRKMAVTLTYRGGGPGWVAVGARGETNVYSGETTLLDLMQDIANSR